MKRILAVTLFFLFSSWVLAVVANPEPFTLTQKNGQKIMAVQKGDEWNNWIETIDGYTIERNKNEWWVYSGTRHIKDDGLVVGFDNPRGSVKKHFRRVFREVPVNARHHCRLSKPAAVTNYNLLVILVEFSDQSSLGAKTSNWANKVFQDSSNSLVDYYNEISYGQFLIIAASETHGTSNDGVVGWLDIGYNHPNTNMGVQNQQLTKDAIIAADPYVDFSSFDINGDGYISVSELGILVVAAGYEVGFGSTYNNPGVWGHQYSLDPPGGPVPAPTCDGVKVAEWVGAGDPRTGGYMQIGEWHQRTATDGHMATIGIMAHEFGHNAFGLPDLYDYDQSSAGIGCFGLMGDGEWGWKITDIYQGTTPVHMCAWSKEFCGFITPITPTSGTSNSIREASNYQDIYKLSTSDANQYFLVENRQLSGYDEGLWGKIQDTTAGGLAVWHVDMSKLNTTNNDNENQKLVDLEEAEGNNELDSNTNQGDKEDLFYQGNKTSFTDSTVPDSKLYDGTSTNIEITSISSSGPTMTAFFSIPNPPLISLNRSRLDFGSTPPGLTTGSQNLLVSNRGGGTLNWSIVVDAAWLNCTPSSGTGSGNVTVSVDPTGLSAGTYTGTINVSDPGAGNSPQSVSVTLQVYSTGQNTYPFGNFATPNDGSTVRSSIPVTGWALDDIGVQSVKIYRGNLANLIYIGDAIFVEGQRPDVEKAFPGYPMNYKAGWGYMMLTNFLPGGGNGTFTIYAIATDIEGYQVLLGTKTIICDNANAVKPFGAIDTPTQGGTASGSSFINWGWVLTPQPNSIPTDGSTIKVEVDGVNIGNPTYNVFRPDIATLFPGYANSNGAIGYFYLDTTTYTNGVHTIQWVATDDAGNTDGIGSRYFTIQNTGGSPKTGAEVFNVDIDPSQIPVDDLQPIRIKKGYSESYEKIRLETIYPGDSGKITIEIRELEKIEIQFFEGDTEPSLDFVKSTLNRNVEHRLLNVSPLPVGSTLDTRMGRFYWQPGPGFVGEYSFLFIMKNREGEMKLKKVNIIIRPKSEVFLD
ncbi:MAG: M6 family metalloprotease domain-containing protein [Candidatus Aminicenantes bacterium]|nr:M6 family metalloprotease domain-containing protein [Candidatus Aminicenantes bacterium]NIM82226.1 M6 family metalloprotease domain-containing protein [Candidatus Aminicenantes bacterium]NIN21627.1 M6 family metalloprotease domain-containing protein [Candidatus Aminicenantes bacterium]NIN45437.1 M6 family metalloprotease domain-containing protein [Candidatus Aminicenantes bacterium]NIN88259.1 M6 family metalloprotease domain-containing protein [Candidatus Aminicenantes bacterium]